MISRRNPSRTGGPTVVDGGEVPPGTPWGPARAGVQEIRQIRAARRTDVLPGSLLCFAGLLIAGAIAGGAYVAYESQRLFQFANNHHDALRAVISAALPDVGWTALSLVALVAALRGRSALRARVGVVVFFGLSTASQVLYADHTVAGYVAAVVAPVTMAYLIEVFVDGVRRWVCARRGESVEDSMPVLLRLLRSIGRLARALLGVVLWFIRLLFAPKSTASGLRAWVVETAPYAPGRTLIGERAHAAELEAADAARQVEAAERRAREAEQRAAAEIERERERAAELVREIAAARPTETVGERPESDGQGPRWANKSEGFRRTYADRLAAGDPILMDPDTADSARAAHIASLVIGEDGSAMSESRARAVLYEIYREQGRPGDQSPISAGSAVPTGSGMIGKVNGS